ncbi:MAG: hypothetical protein NZ932_03140 [Candidatus Bathyarchaeota archaeon]|nr:hypothetical protein [Candidatus Bathyarchaeota archaeon]MDW8040148.1 hypothetical protein [Nitrososphaerota archaeon]
MAGSTIDHLIAMTVFLGAILIFIGLFNQTIQTAILYQRNRYLATKCSDLLDNILLNPGIPENWGRSNCTPTSFGLQDPEFTQYRLSPFSLMRLVSASGRTVTYPKLGLVCSNITMGFGNFLLVPHTKAINYPLAAKLLGVNGTYGFQLTITPIVSVSISKTQSNPVTFSVNVKGAGFPLSGAVVSYCLITVKPTGGQGQYPSFTTQYGTAYTSAQGSALLSFPTIDDTQDSYVLIVYVHHGGLVGTGYYGHVLNKENYIVPFVYDLGEESGKVLLAHSWDVHGGDHPAAVTYNATFVILTEDFTLREIPLGTGRVGLLNYGNSPHTYEIITIPTYNPGILVVTYRKSANPRDSGVVLMPWGVSSMAFPVIFGEDPSNKTWVATDIRQVLVGNVAYQAKLALWSLEGYQVIG